MSCLRRVVTLVVAVAAAPALAQFCTAAVPECKDAQCKCSSSGTMVSDPIESGAGSSLYRTEDVHVPGALGDLSLRRSYTSSIETWYQFPVDGPPMPFGPSPTVVLGTKTLHWWHSYYAFARESEDFDETPSYYVRTLDGRFSEFGQCGSPPCFADNSSALSDPARKDRLERTGAGFVHHLEDGRQLVFESEWGQNGATTHYFLSSILDRSGATAATIAYSTPTGLGVTCPEGESGYTSSGVPYVSSITTAEGAELLFGYQSLAPPPGITGVQCVLGSIGLRNRSTAQSETVATYDYTTDGGVEYAGLLASATFAGGRQLAYQYSQTNLIITGQSTVTHSYGLDAGLRAVRAETPTEDVAIHYPAFSEGVFPVDGTWPDGGTCPVAYFPRTLVDSAATLGNGDAGSSTWSRVSDVALTNGNFDPRLISYTDSCTSPACSPGTVVRHFGCDEDNAEGLPDRLLATRDKRGNWTAYDYSMGQNDAGAPDQTELRSIALGASDEFGTGALETTDFTWGYGPGAQQLKLTEERDSLLGGSGARTEKHNVYDGGNRLAAEIDKGWTMMVDGGAELRYRAVFYFTNHECLSGSDDALGRTLEVHGPCWADSLTATDCSTTLNSGAVPVVQYHYFEADAGLGNAAGRLARVRRFTNAAAASSCSSAAYLDIDYEAYDALGNATDVRDENGILTTLEWTEDRLTSVTKADAGFNFGYDGEELTSVEYPEGNFDVYCYRTGTSGSCSGGTLTDRLQWQAKAPTSTGASYSEKIAYTYWPNGTVASASYLDSGGNVRRVERFAVDAHRRPTWQGWGDSSGSAVFEAARSFDGADNLTGVGHASNAPPAWCGGVDSAGSPLSSLCQKLKYDAADRLVSVADPGTSQATLFQHDAHGNITGIKLGCGTSDTWSGCTRPRRPTRSTTSAIQWR